MISKLVKSVVALAVTLSSVQTFAQNSILEHGDVLVVSAQVSGKARVISIEKDGEISMFKICLLENQKLTNCGVQGRASGYTNSELVARREQLQSDNRKAYAITAAGAVLGLVAGIVIAKKFPSVPSAIPDARLAIPLPVIFGPMIGAIGGAVVVDYAGLTSDAQKSIDLLGQIAEGRSVIVVDNMNAVVSQLSLTLSGI